MSFLLRNTLLLLSAASWALASSASERTLHWKALEVAAQLDAKGQLHVIEKQSIVFDGDWNGAERRFNIRNGQSVQLKSLEEIDETTGAHTLFQEGSLDSTQHWAWPPERLAKGLASFRM